MRIAPALLFAGLSVLAACTPKAKAPPAAEKSEKGENEADVRDIASEAKIPLSQALAAGLAAKPGEAIEAALEGETESGKRSVFFEVVVLDTAGTAWEVKLSPADGKVLSVAKEADAAEIADAAAVRAALPAKHMALADLLAAASKSGGGTPVKVAFRAKKLPLTCRARFLAGKEISAVVLDPVTGQPAAAK
jgi:hypothetical protein